MRRSIAIRATLVALSANFLLLLLKAYATTLSDSLTIFSETLNSTADLASAVVILLCVRWAWMVPDEDHPFGHRRAEPLSGLVVAIFTGILGFEVLRTAVVRSINGDLPEHIGRLPNIALVITGVVKAWLAGYFNRCGRQLDSPAFRAAAADSRNDVIVAAQALVGVVAAAYGAVVLDHVSAAVVGGYILYSAHRIGTENIDYLMGKAPEPELLEQISKAAEQPAGVREIDDVKAHYVGTFVHVELTARVDGALTTVDSHAVAEAARAAVERITIVDRAFVHIEPCRKPPPPPATADQPP